MGERIWDLPNISSPEGLEAADLLLVVDESGSPTCSNVTIQTLGQFIGTNYATLAGTAVGDISMNGHYLNLGTGTGGSGGTLRLDGGGIEFADINGDYDNPATIRTGTFGTYGGISLICWAGYEANWQNGVLNLPGTINGGGQINLNNGTLNPDSSSSLATDGSGNWTITANTVINMPSMSFVSQSLTSANNGQTLTTSPRIYWVDNSSPFTVYLPLAASMTNRPIKFICTQQISEQWLSIQVNGDDDGPQIQQAGTSFNMDGFSAVEFTSDGTNWWITGGYNVGTE